VSTPFLLWHHIVRYRPSNTYVISGGKGYQNLCVVLFVALACTYYLLDAMPMASPPPPAAASQPSTHPRTSSSFLSHNMTSHDIIPLLRAWHTQDQGAEVLSPEQSLPSHYFCSPTPQSIYRIIDRFINGGKSPRLFRSIIQ